MRILLYPLAVLGAVWLVSSALFTVDRAEYVYLTQFGRHVGTYDGRTDAGLHVKWPWPVQSVLRFDNRLQFFDLQETQLLTKDAERGTVDKPLLIGAYVCWRIAGKDGGSDGVDQFVRAVGTAQQARSILEQRIISQLGAEISELALDDLISTGAKKKIDERMEEIRGRLLGRDSYGLHELARRDYGIELVDIRLRRFNYPPSVRSEIFARIVSERQKKVADYTTEGEEKAVDIESKARREARDIETRARAEKKRQEERANVLADAIRNEAQSKDPEFYTFLQKLEAYQTILSTGRDVLLLSGNHELFDMLLKPPRAPSMPRPPAPAKPGDPSPKPTPMTQETLPPPKSPGGT
jgi:membrane protease subunit HflC